jgi:hypothetical protein
MQTTTRIKAYSYTDRIIARKVLQSIKIKTQKILYAALVGRIIVEQGATSASKVDSGLERDFKAISLLKV